MILAVTGGVAAGKSTFAETLRTTLSRWPESPNVTIVATDGFLFSNTVLAARGISMRKGFPDSYDFDALVEKVASLRTGARTAIPTYSHVTYDVDPERRQIVERADVAILDGLHLGHVRADASGTRLIDALVYLDADDEDMARWFRGRLHPLMTAGRTDPGSFYHAFRTMDDAAVDAFITRVWETINLPNLRDHIVRDRARAEVVVRKNGDHSIKDVLFQG